MTFDALISVCDILVLANILMYSVSVTKARGAADSDSLKVVKCLPWANWKGTFGREGWYFTRWGEI